MKAEEPPPVSGGGVACFWGFFSKRGVFLTGIAHFFDDCMQNNLQSPAPLVYNGKKRNAGDYAGKQHRSGKP